MGARAAPLPAATGHLHHVRHRRRDFAAERAGGVAAVRRLGPGQRIQAQQQRAARAVLAAAGMTGRGCVGEGGEGRRRDPEGLEVAVCVCVCVCVCACVRACARDACMRVRAGVRVRAFVCSCVRARVRACARACVCGPEQQAADDGVGDDDDGAARLGQGRKRRQRHPGLWSVRVYVRGRKRER